MNKHPAKRPALGRAQHEQRSPGKLHNKVEAQIRQYIQDHEVVEGMQLPTEAEFCDLFGVSRSTVRHALQRLEAAGLIGRTRGRGTFLLNPKQQDALGPLDANAIGRAGSRPAKTRNTIGVVFSYASEIDVMQTAILRGIEHAVKSRGYNLLFGRSDDWDEAGEAKAIADLYQIGVAGFVVLPVSNRSMTTGIKTLLERNVPVVLVDRYLSDLDTSYVVSDNYNGAYRATEHLILLGYRCVAFVVDQAEGAITDQLATTSIRDRYAGYCQALRDYNLEETIHPPAPVDHTSGESLKQLLASLGQGLVRPPALVALHDHLATEIINTALQMGLRPPEDFAIVGFDDLPFASRLSVPLTTVVQSRYDIGFRAGHLLADKIAGNAIRNEKVSLLVSLVVRASCGARRVLRQSQSLATR
jgi:DNA-binding LacI/PurR family transcriptional regulator